ncbi:MAG: TAT-variant-translocated molybdopterin oxidoreductase [Rhodothermales bacterium]|nr:TAT-variant-translocated molybdopterin oxidoreductase [Rhodothermales bacterium]
MIELPVITKPESDSGSPHKRFWRSLRDLERDPEFIRSAKTEFLPGASDAPGESSRRQFVQLMAASMAMVSLSACRKPVEKILPYTRKPEEIVPGNALHYATSMPDRGVVSGLLVESREGRPVKIEGNPQHPYNQGSSGVFEQASILNLYDPDRSQQVLRDGTTSTWADFVAAARQLGSSNRTLAVVSEPVSSPTLAGLRSQLSQNFGTVLWSEYDPTLAGRQEAGYSSAFGTRVRPRFRFSQATTIVSFDADFLAPTSFGFIENTREYAASRRITEPTDSVSRLYAIESDYSITGGMADNRLGLRSGEIASFAAAVASLVGVAGAGRAGLAFVDHPFAKAIADELQQSGRNSVCVAGASQPELVHTLCAAINDQLGAIGTTVELLNTSTVSQPNTSVEDVISRMRSGTVDVLLVLGANPAYDIPSSFAEAMSSVATTIHCGSHVDETARLAGWHLPKSHYLEAWGDGRAYDGTLSVIQPLIAPLYDSHSDIEVLNVLANGTDLAGYDLVRQQWSNVISSNFEQRWKQVLHDGILPSTSFATVSASTGAINFAGLAANAVDDIEVVIRADSTVLDGSFANNAWLQETPDPVTKIVWDNVALLSQATADQLGVGGYVSKGKYYADLITIEANGSSVELPVWIVPGHADNSITLSLGYGRNISTTREQRRKVFFDTDQRTDVYGSGALANGVGKNVAVLRTGPAESIVRGVSVSRTGADYLLATTQDHGATEPDSVTIEKRDPVRMATVDEYRANPDFVVETEPLLPGGEDWDVYPELWSKSHPKEENAFKDNPYFQNQWAMSIDLNTCTGCNTCMVACQSENNIQVVGKDEVSRGREMHWIRMDRYFVSDGDLSDNPQMVVQPVPCMHCENAPCESVCPVAATVHSPDGTNQMIYNRCIGTRYCANNCPYKVRRFNFYNWTKTLPLSVHMAQNPDVTVRSRGVMEKCSYCIQRIRKANAVSNLENRTIEEGDVQTACQQACPAQAITFGDLTDPDSEINKVRSSSRRYEMLAPLNVKPRTSYLARINNPDPALAQSEA